MQLDHLPYKDQLVRGLAHKMNNILTLFHGYVGLMLDNHELDQTTRANLSKIKEGACAASTLIDRTDALMRNPTVASHDLDLAFFLELLHPVMKAMCGPETVLEVRLSPGTPHVRTDSGHLRSALLELVRNACDATAQTGGRVRVEIGPAAGPETTPAGGADGEGWLSLAVIDDGQGIPEELAPRIFQPFFTTKRRQNSAGLGLNVANEAVQSLGGLLRRVPQPEKTKFEILIPIGIERPADCEARALVA